MQYTILLNPLLNCKGVRNQCSSEQGDANFCHWPSRLHRDYFQLIQKIEDDAVFRIGMKSDLSMMALLVNYHQQIPFLLMLKVMDLKRECHYCRISTLVAEIFDCKAWSRAMQQSAGSQFIIGTTMFCFVLDLLGRCCVRKITNESPMIDFY
jgi:hypothetical protein